MLRHESPSWRSLAWAGGLAVASSAALLAATTPTDLDPASFRRSEPVSPAPRYGRDIRPILSNHCFQCHGPDAGKRQAELRLDRFEDATAARKGGAAIVPGDPSGSELMRRVTSDDPQFHMPPPESNKPRLTAQERELVQAWIAGGAAYEPHWAFVAPARPALPQVANDKWSRNAIDRFVLARLESEGVTPSPQADRPTLARRAFLDVTGLPPTPEELDAFLADTSPDAYERLIDRLLSQEPYVSRHAERMAASWMDQSRYADTCGIHMDAGRQMWLWRDWVLEAYRSNMPFDRFVTEQIAGDLIPDATDSQKIASGFNRNHVTSDEGGAIAEEYLVEYAVDRTATTGSVFLGLTVGCARCHDHKFDPVSQQEFYSLYAYFNSIEEPGLYSQDQNSNRAHEPFLSVPTPVQKAELSDIGVKLAVLKKKQDERTPEEDQQRAAFFASALQRSGVAWATTSVTSARSTGGATVEAQPDGSVRVSGANPKKDDHEITLRTDATGLRLLMLEALPEPTAFEGRFGRSPNGNAVVSGVVVEAVSVADPTRRTPVKLVWAWADHSQPDGDFDVTNVIEDNGGARGWALDAHRVKGGRVALFLTQEPLGYEGGTEIHVRLQYQSMYDNHVLAHVRLSVASINDAGLAMLPRASSRWYTVGPFPPDAKGQLYEPVFGPEQGEVLDFKRNFGTANQYWHFDASLADGRTVSLPEGINVTFVGRYIYSPTDAQVPVSLGSDDGFALFVNAKEVAARKVDRGVQPDQDKATLPLHAGRNSVVMKIINTGSLAGYYYKASESAELAGDLVAGLLPAAARSAALESRLERAWRVAFLPSYRENAAAITALDKRVTEINAAVPRTMVMKELPKPRETFVLTRGQYDKPDKNRPVQRAVPAALGPMPEGAPANRLGLAAWLMSDKNPLLARVTVNRLWESAFGTGLVRTSEDFGQQGEWPSHPELLDWLAVEFREQAWDIRHIQRLILTSSTYRQSSHARPDLKDRDPDNRWLAAFPRRRLSAEQTRDQALYVSSLLVEKLGGPSVKPYQPDGLWQEVAMPQSNTREYKPGMGEDLWRRSLYTYWKRASPPPSMLTLDAPTREFCTIRRASTSTPLQALVLWNDEQFVEAARVLAVRTLREPGDDRQRLTKMFRRCTARIPDAAESASLLSALARFRERYAAAPADAAALLKRGATPPPADLDAAEVAAWTMLANAALNLYETNTLE